MNLSSLGLHGCPLGCGGEEELARPSESCSRTMVWQRRAWRVARCANRSRCVRAVRLGPVSATPSLAGTDAAGGSAASLRAPGNYALT